MACLYSKGSVLYDAAVTDPYAGRTEVCVCPIAVTDPHAGRTEVCVCPIAVTTAIWYDADKEACRTAGQSCFVRDGKRPVKKGAGHENSMEVEQ